MTTKLEAEQKAMELYRAFQLGEGRQSTFLNYCWDHDLDDEQMVKKFWDINRKDW